MKRQRRETSPLHGEGGKKGTGEKARDRKRYRYTKTHMNIYKQQLIRVKNCKKIYP